MTWGLLTSSFTPFGCSGLQLEVGPGVCYIFPRRGRLQDTENWKLNEEEEKQEPENRKLKTENEKWKTRQDKKNEKTEYIKQNAENWKQEMSQYLKFSLYPVPSLNMCIVFLAYFVKKIGRNHNNVLCRFVCTKFWDILWHFGMLDAMTSSASLYRFRIVWYKIQDALEVMFVTHSLSEHCQLLFWCDPGDWWARIP